MFLIQKLMLVCCKGKNKVKTIEGCTCILPWQKNDILEFEIAILLDHILSPQKIQTKHHDSYAALSQCICDIWYPELSNTYAFYLDLLKWSLLGQIYKISKHPNSEIPIASWIAQVKPVRGCG